MPSLTLVGVFVSILAALADKFGLNVERTDLETTALTVAQFAGLIVAWYGRYRAGGISWYGKKK